MTLITKINKFLLVNSGVIGESIQNQFEDSQSPMTLFYFQPYKSHSNTFFRSVSIVTAPVCFSVLALEFALASIFFTFKMIGEAAFLNQNDAKMSADYSLKSLLTMAVAICAVFLSPFINAADLIGGGINTLVQDNSSEEINSPLNK